MRTVMKSSVLILLAVVTFPTGCKKPAEEGVSHHDGWDDSTMVNTDIRAFLDGLAPLAQTFTVDPLLDNQFVTNSGTRFQIPKENFYNDSGEKITSIGVGITLFEYLTNRDLVTGNMSTIAGDRLLNTTDIFTLYANGRIGEPLHFKDPVTVTVPLHGTVNSGTGIFTGSENTHAALNRVTWNKDTISWYDAFPGYGFSLITMGWYNAGSPLPDPQGNTTPFTLQLPDGFGNQNSVSFLLSPGRGAMQLIAQPKAETFSTGTCRVPVGQVMKVFTIGYKEAGFSYNLQSTTVTADQHLIIDTMQNVSKATLTNVIAYSLD